MRRPNNRTDSEHLEGAIGSGGTPLPLRAAAASGRSVTVGGQRYEIGGYGWGRVPAWRLVKKNGQPLTGPEFEALPLSDKQELAAHVQSHVDSLGSPVRDGSSALDDASTMATAMPVHSLLAEDDDDEEEEEEYFPTGAVGGAPVNALSVNAGQGPSAGTAATSARGKAVFGGRFTQTLSGPPPSVPEPGPALIEPEWGEGRLRLPNRLPTNDLEGDAVVSLQAALRVDFVNFIDTMEQFGTNFHPAARRAIEDMTELLSGSPDQTRVFQMGHAVERLEALQPVADAELPDALRLQYRTLVDHFRRLVDRFPSWRALTSKARAEPLTDEEAQQAVPIARELVAALATTAAGELVDDGITNALSGLADAAEAASGVERSLLAFDLVASVKQFMTALMRPVVYCWNEYASGAWDQATKLPREFGTGTVKWGSRTIAAIAALYLGAGPLSVVAARAATAYPALAWLQQVAEFLKLLATLPKA